MTLEVCITKIQCCPIFYKFICNIVGLGAGESAFGIEFLSERQ